MRQNKGTGPDASQQPGRPAQGCSPERVCDLLEELLDLAEEFTDLCQLDNRSPTSIKIKCYALSHKVPYQHIIDTDEFSTLKAAVISCREIELPRSQERQENKTWLFEYDCFWKAVVDFHTLLNDSDNAIPAAKDHACILYDHDYQSPLDWPQYKSFAAKTRDIQQVLGTKLSLTNFTNPPQP